MKRTDPVCIGEALGEYLSARNLQRASLQGSAVELWGSVAGPYVASMTEDVYLRGGTLHVRFSSSAVTQEVMMRRSEIIRAMNEAIGSEVVRQLRVL